MDPELKRMIEETRALARDNHRMLRAIRRHQWYGVISTIIVWAVILALPLYFYQKYFQPVVARFSEITGTTTSNQSAFPASAELEKLLHSFKAGQ